MLHSAVEFLAGIFALQQAVTSGKTPLGLADGVLGGCTKNQQGEWKYVKGKALNQILHVHLS